MMRFRDTTGGSLMIVQGSGDLLDADVDALVNAVNCVGVMGKGLALQFEQRFTGCFAAYAAASSSRSTRRAGR